MKTKMLSVVYGILLATVIGTSSVWAAKAKAKVEAPPPLSEDGQKLETTYAEQMKALKAEIVKALPKVDEQKKAAYLKACEAEKAAEAKLVAAEKNRNGVKSAQALVAHAKGKWIGGADKGIAAAKEKLNKATTDAERKAAQEELEKWQKNRDAGVKALKERQAALDKAKAEEPKLIEEYDAAKEALNEAKAGALKAFKDLDLENFLASDALDAKLAKYIVLSEATSRGLAEFAEKGEAQEKLVEALLANDALLIQMAVADGANSKREGRGYGPAQYGPAMKIYTDILQASSRAKEGNLQRLALAIGLEHAVPVAQRNPKGKTDAPATVDPVKRYLHYEKAYLGGELDPEFKNHSVWSYRSGD